MRDWSQHGRLLAGVAVLAMLGWILWPPLDSGAVLDLEEGTLDASAHGPDGLWEASGGRQDGDAEATSRVEIPDPDQGERDVLVVIVRKEDGTPATRRSIVVTGVDPASTWQVRSPMLADGWGRTEIDLPGLMHTAERHGSLKVRVGIWSEATRSIVAAQVVDLRETKSVELTAPPLTGLKLRLEDFPEGMAPRLSAVDAPQLRDFQALGWLQDDGTWLFQDLPVGIEWEVRFAWVDLSRGPDRVRYRRPSKLPTQRVQGPRLSGEVIAQSLWFPTRIAWRGQLVAQDGAPFDFYLQVSGVLRGHALAQGSAHQSIEIKIESDDEGHFLAMRADGSELTGLEQLHLSWYPAKTTYLSSAQEEGLHPMGATVRLAEFSEDRQLGQVRLSSEATTLVVQVRDPKGEGLYDAGVTVGPAGAPPTEHLATDAFGIARFVEAPWRLTAAGASSRRVVVRVDRYVEVTRDIPYSQSELEIELERAGSVTGSCRNAPTSEPFWVHVVPAGVALEDADPLRSERLERSELRDVVFDLDGIKPGLVDVVFSWSTQDWEVLRIPGIVVESGTTVRPEVLQAIDFGQRIRWLELVPRGERLKLLSLGGPTVSTTQSGRELIAHEVHGRGESLWIPFTEAQSSWSGTLRFRFFQDVKLQGLAPGRHEIELKERRSIQLVAPSVDFSRDGTWAVDLVLWGALDEEPPDGVDLERGEDGAFLYVGGPRQVTLYWYRMSEDLYEYEGSTKIDVTESTLEVGEIQVEPPDSRR